MRDRKRFNVPASQAEATFVLMGCRCVRGPSSMWVYPPPVDWTGWRIEIRHGYVHPTTLGRVTRAVTMYMAMEVLEE